MCASATAGALAVRKRSGIDKGGGRGGVVRKRRKRKGGVGMRATVRYKDLAGKIGEQCV